MAGWMGNGDLGFLPVIAALVAICLLFQAANPAFLTPRNLSNLSLQLGALGIMTLGLVPVLLIGEIDLSAGSVLGFCASVMAVLATRFEEPASAIGAAVALGAVIGLAQGLWIVVIQAPSFIVTLTGLLVWQGAQRLMLGDQTGELEISDPFIQGIASTYMPFWLAAAIVAAAAAAAALHCARIEREHAPLGAKLGQWAAAAPYPVVAAAVVLILQQYFGVPYLLLLLAALAAALTVLIERTPFGVHVYAVGGNAEAARRAGVNVAAVRVVVFAMCSALAALAGVVSASRQFAVDSSTGGGSLVLDAIAAAVIGGTSVFGGRGRIVGGLLGAVVIASVANGLDLLGQSADVKTIITGLILLAAVSIDRLARRRVATTGRGSS